MIGQQSTPTSQAKYFAVMYRLELFCVLVLTVFSFEIGRQHKRGALKQCMCRGEYLETHGYGSGTRFVGACKEGWYNCRDQPTTLTTCCKEKKKDGEPTDEITAPPFHMIGAPGFGWLLHAAFRLSEWNLRTVLSTFQRLVRACLHGGGGPRVGEVTSLSIWSLILIWSRLHDRRGDPPRRVARYARPSNPLSRGQILPCKRSR